MASSKPRVKVPKTAKKGDVIEIKTLISHKMETGQRKDKKTGKPIPRKIINKFVATFDGEQVFAVDVEPAVSANPYIKFNMRAEKTGDLVFTWVDDDGKSYTAKKTLTVN
ncbi:MAG: thiosulfate oxidation carrier complex protein SoxZ [Hyphomicrobiaceae bacterium]|nr:thiosulfate oxidation carrier complex protein SoxZ [Hyphomicrobiaceae bacterium]